MSVFEDLDAIQSLIAGVVELRNVVKCPICLDIIKDPLQISCNHIFCGDCINSFINKKPTKLHCPICRKGIKRQHQAPNENIDQLIQFVNKVNEKLKGRFGDDTCHKVNTKDKSSTSSNAVNKGILNISTKNLPTKTVLQNKLPKISNTVKKDAFDMLLESSAVSYTVKRQSNYKTYTNRKSKQKINEGSCHKLCFEDDEYRLKIIEWLCDNRNEFERLTQTQSIIDDDSKSSASSLDLPSISQEGQLMSWTPKNKRLVNRRTKSLEVKVKRSEMEPKRHNSFSGDSGKDVEDLNIEDADSDKDILHREPRNIIQMLEEQCLSIIESQVMLQDKEIDLKKPKKTRKRRNKKNEGNETIGRSMGWTRIQQVNKSINRNNREMKKLCVSSTSTKLDKKCIAGNSFQIQNNVEEGIKKTGARPIVLLNKLSSEYELSRADISKGNAKTFGLQEVESFLENNINIRGSIDENNLGLSSKEDEDAINIPTAKAKENSVTKIDNIQAVVPPIEASLEVVAEHNHWNLVSGSNQGTNKTKQTTCSGSIFSDKHEDVDLFTLPTQKIVPESYIDKVEQELRGLFSSPETIDKNKSLNIDKETASFKELDEIGVTLHQLCASAHELEKSYKDNINIDVLILSIKKLKSLIGILKTKDEIPFVLQKENKVCINSAVQTEDYDSSGFKISSTVDFTTLVQCNAAVQTDEIKDQSYLRKLWKTLNNTKNLNTSTQTFAFNRKSIAIQTIETCELAVNPTNSDGEKTKALENEEPIYIGSNSSVSSKMSEVFINNDEFADYYKENYQFTESLDRINFDTQTVLNENKKCTQNLSPNKRSCNTQSQKQIKKKNPFNKVEFSAKPIEVCTSSSGVEILEIEEAALSAEHKSGDNQEAARNISTPNSTISFSLTQEDKNCVNDSLVKRFKRVRALLEDCEDGVIKKLKKQENPYFMPQLSVEIISQAPEEVGENKLTTQSNTSPSMQTSQILNYDEYLDRIMKNYEQTNVKTSTPKRKLPSTSKQTKSQYIIDKCNALIKEAAISPVSSPTKKLCKEFDITSEDIVQEFNQPFDETVINKQVLQVTPKRVKTHSESIFCKNLKILKNGVDDEIPFSNTVSIANEFAEEMEPVSFKSVTPNKSFSEIKILQNVLLQKDVTDEASKLQYNLEDEWNKMDEKVERGSQTSEEVFSDTDVDVVETTPQKDKSSSNILFLSQSLQKRHSINKIPVELPPPEDSPDIILATDVTSYLNKTFDPPTAFQDCNPVLSNENQDILLHLNEFDDTLVHLNDVIDVDDNSDSDDTLVNVDKTVVNKGNNQKYVRQESNNASKSRRIARCEKWTTECKQNSKQSPQEKPSKSNAIDTSNFLPLRRDLNLIDCTLKSNYNPLEIIPVKPQVRKVSKLISVATKQESILNYVSQTKSSQQPKNAVMEPLNRSDKPCISCTRLGRDQVIAISSLTNKKLATYSNTFNSSVTHMIVSVNEKNCIQDHTMKFVSAVAAGVWVLGFKWVQECLAQNKIISEEPYEALDVSGVPGPKISRLTRLEQPLLKGFLIHAAPPFVSISKPDLENVIQMLGGKTVPTLKELGQMSGIRLIITEAKQTQDFEIYETWLEIFKVVTVDIEWLSRSVGQFQLLSLKPFSLCSDDNISQLGYPEELLADTPFSFSQSMHV